MSVGVLDYFLISLAAIFVIVNPLSTAFVFQSLLPKASKKRKLDIAYRSTSLSTAILISFALAGGLIFKLFGVSIGAFRIAGGIILFGIAMNMIRHHEGEHDEKAVTEEEFATNIAIIPIAIPFMSGPGAIATVMILANEAASIYHVLFVLVAVGVVMTACYYALIYSDIIVRFIGDTGKRVMTRLFGLILVVIAIQFVINGVIDTLPLVIEAWNSSPPLADIIDTPAS